MTTENVTLNFNWLGLLTVVFIVLKLTGFIAWSWWWVLAPFWIPLALAAAILAVFGVVWVIALRKS